MDIKKIGLATFGIAFGVYGISLGGYMEIGLGIFSILLGIFRLRQLWKEHSSGEEMIKRRYWKK